ncbi:hypothetical protein DMC64_22305 [Amycolatopsis sp. WAC 04197]|uniref:hypothetical protein n=1 Tax=Amycolatopsis sp. WAC 04197 TaxID=2203199 RepID=UPI000F784AB0|nr:hypothetical protein [Amycolatopsis sp. WAC 04197]RSN43376.1 hypothetical protein DMC64_22305 [Amycolatopsis sp. WAC 04197]
MREPLYRRVNTRARLVHHDHGGDHRHQRNTKRELAAARLDSPAPIHWLVARRPHERRDRVRLDEASYYSGLYVDDDNRLQVVDPELGVDDMEPMCPCCTHTFNGVRFTRKYRQPPR